jgi:hypothetical protein
MGLREVDPEYVDIVVGMVCGRRWGVAERDVLAHFARGDKYIGRHSAVTTTLADSACDRNGSEQVEHGLRRPTSHIPLLQHLKVPPQAQAWHQDASQSASIAR